MKGWVSTQTISDASNGPGAPSRKPSSPPRATTSTRLAMTTSAEAVARTPKMAIRRPEVISQERVKAVSGPAPSMMTTLSVALQATTRNNPGKTKRADPSVTPDQNRTVTTASDTIRLMAAAVVSRHDVSTPA